MSRTVIQISLSQYQIRKLSSYLLTFSQLVAGSVILKFFDPRGELILNTQSTGFLAMGVIIFLISFFRRIGYSWTS